jgi:2-oxoglutarate dehydrogenase E1 component
MDAQGPEHSSARIERFLQMMEDEDEEKILSSDFQNESVHITQIQKSNFQVCYPSTSSNYFHLMRRQLKRDFRKPLILILSKKLLKHRMAFSEIESFDEKTMFIKVRGENNKNILKNPENVKTVLLCTGQIFIDLIQTREKLNRNDIAIVIFEQIGPFPYLEISEAIKQFRNAKFVWIQEEHRNQGAWDYIYHRMTNLLKKMKFKNPELKYVGRKESAVASTGYIWIFQQEHEKLIKEAFE